MKEYRKEIRILYWLLLPVGAITTLSLHFEEWFPWSTKLDNILYAITLPLLALPPLNCFAGIVSLRVTEKSLERIWIIFKTCTISRKNIVASSRSILGVYCMIFSNSDLSHARTIEIIRAAIKRKAIIHPYIYQIKKDFPEWFEKATTN